MTKERRDTINRRLAEFDNLPVCSMGCHIIEDSHPWRGRNPLFCDYTTDLNALAHLEAKLPPHTWQVDYGRLQPRIEVELRVELEDSDVYSMADFIIEVEARAEAIYQYLTRETNELHQWLSGHLYVSQMPGIIKEWDAGCPLCVSALNRLLLIFGLEQGPYR